MAFLVSRKVTKDVLSQVGLELAEAKGSQSKFSNKTVLRRIEKTLAVHESNKNVQLRKGLFLVRIEIHNGRKRRTPALIAKTLQAYQTIAVENTTSRSKWTYYDNL